MLYNSEISDKVISKIDDFIDSYLNSFLNLYIDSWIKNVWEIINNYENLAYSFRDTIYLRIEETFLEEILWHKPITNRKKYLFLQTNNYRLKIFYIENKIKKIRKIYNIEFNKK
jgi:hypothetical protein